MEPVIRAYGGRTMPLLSVFFRLTAAARCSAAAFFANREPGKNRSPAGRTQRGCDKSIGKISSLAGQAIHIRCFQPGHLAGKAHEVKPVIIRKNKDDVLGSCIRYFFKSQIPFRLLCKILPGPKRKIRQKDKNRIINIWFLK